MPAEPSSLRLVVFADDWGRHPSSCQHLIRHLLPRHRVLWVNTIGTRRPGLSREDLAKVGAKLVQWFGPGVAGGAADGHPNLQIISPRMWPGFRSAWQCRLNAGLITRAVTRALGDAGRGKNCGLRNADCGSEGSAPGISADTIERCVALTTLPVTADLVGRLPVDRWIYYSVDDFSVWPGLDADVMRTMERQLVGKVDGAVAASEALAARLLEMGRPSQLLTHGIDPDHWRAVDAPSVPDNQSARSAIRNPQSAILPNPGTAPSPALFAGLPRPIILFWGVVDQRLDISWCDALATTGGTLVLVGPQQSPDPRLAAMGHVRLPGPVAYADLPALARAADVLVMPYADLPVTRAMQPLKFKEYLATGKPVVSRRLPATADWGDCADLVDSVDAFVAKVRERAETGTPAEQLAVRQRRLASETWEAKARELERLF